MEAVAYESKSARKRAEDTRRNYDLELVSTLNIIKSELEHLQNSFDYVMDPELVDSYTYEILALKTKYCYYLNLCKQRGIWNV